jgi:hypothetical protein
MEKVAQKCGPILSFSKRLSKVNFHPVGENFPNLATLFATSWRFIPNLSKTVGQVGLSHISLHHDHIIECREKCIFNTFHALEDTKSGCCLL